MGIKTDFWGEIKVTPQPTDEFVDKFNDFCEGDHNDHDDSSRNVDSSRVHRPSRWCYWHLERGDDSEEVVLKMPGFETNVEAVGEWLSYLVQHWFKPNGYRLSGTVHAQDEENFRFKVSVCGSTVKWHKGRTKYASRGTIIRWTPPPVLKSKIDRSKVQPDVTA